MSVGKILYDRLKNDPTLAAHVRFADTDGLTKYGIYPRKVPQGRPRKALTYKRLGQPRIQSLDGPAGREDCRVEIEAWAENDGDLEVMAKAIQRPTANGGPLDGFRGVVAGFLVHKISKIDQEDDFQPPIHDSDRSTLGERFEFMVSFEEQY